MSDYRDFLSNKKYQVVIAGLSGGPVVAVMQNDLSIAGGNDFTTAGEVLRDVPIAGAALTVKDKAASLVKIAGRSVTSQFETRLAWSNSLKPNFTIEMTFYQDDANANDSILSQYKRIKSAVLPTAQGKFYKAPLGYKIGNLKGQSLRPSGTLSIQIGEWFRATNVVMVSENFTFSKEVNINGQPLFATGSITLEPFKAVTYKEYQDYFID